MKITTKCCKNKAKVQDHFTSQGVQVKFKQVKSIKHEEANLQDVSVSLESVHECCVQRRRARSVRVLRHLVVNRRQLDRQREKQSNQSSYFPCCLINSTNNPVLVHLPFTLLNVL